MREIDRMFDVVQEEIGKIADKGLTNANIDVAYKLVDMYKDIKTIAGMESYEDDNSYGRHYVRGHYSRDGESYDRYSQAKYDYRHSRTSAGNVMQSLEGYMSDLSDRLSDMLKDADSQEERDKIRSYISKIKNM